MLRVLPVQTIWRGGSTSSIVDVIVPGPAFQRNTEPAATSPCIETDSISGFQVGQRSNAVSTSHTSCGSAEISISAAPTTGAPTSMRLIARTLATAGLEGGAGTGT